MNEHGFEFRAGIGWDIHRTIPGRPLVIGGVAIESAFGLDGHSDADVLLHAVTDALLGAACLGDIGMHFPDTDPRWKDAGSLQFLHHALQLVRAAGFELVSLDSNVILERPKLKDYRNAIRHKMAGTLGLPVDSVSVKFKTSEKVGPVGQGAAAEAQAVVTIKRRV